MKIESRLGKGLSSFFENKPSAVPVFVGPTENNNSNENSINTNIASESVLNDNVKYIPIGNIIPNPNQPRKIFKEEQLQELAQSISKNGILQPILVRSSKEAGNLYEIIAGERRWRAANIAGVYEIPVLIKNFDDKETFEIGLIENLQRENLSAIEEAQGYKNLITNFNYTQEDVSKIMHKSRSYIANILRLLTLPSEVQKMVDDGEISYSIARSLVGAEDALKTAMAIVKDGMTVKEAESFINNKKTPNKIKEPKYTNNTNELNSELIALKENLSNKLGTNIDISIKGQSGEIKILFKNFDELNNVVTKLTNI